MEPRIYLHIFDRELRNFCQSRMSDKEISEIVLMACLLSDDVYVPYSNLMESLRDYPVSVQLVFALEREQLCKIISSEDNIGGFLSSHQQLYRFVKDNYSVYYNSQRPIFPSIPYVPKRDTTSVLREKIRDSMEHAVPRSLIPIADRLHDFITNPETGAVTIGNISQSMQLNEEQKNRIARLISQSYTRRYLDEINGTYIFHLPYLWCLDEELGKSMLDYQFYIKVFRPYFLNKWENPADGMFQIDKIPYELLAVKKDENARNFIYLLRQCADAIFRAYELNDPKQAEQLRSIISTLTVKTTYSYEDGLNRMFLKRTFMQNTNIKMEEDNQEMKVLLVVATDLEFQIVTQYFKEKGCPINFWDANKIRFFILGKRGNCVVYLTRCAMGAHSALGSIVTINKATDSLHPDFVVMVGIAYSIKKEIKLGDVMVSTTIKDADTGKETTNNQGDAVFQSRGLNITADGTLWQTFATTYTVMDISYSVHTGTIITGSQVINSPQKLKDIKERFPEAIGGEMEGNGLLSVPQVPWVLVKAACDKGKKKTDKYQSLAARNAIEYVDYVLSTM